VLDWERTWRGAGVGFVVLIIIASVFYGSQPKLGASPAELVSFFHGDRTRILIATVIFCLSFLELLWFGAALASVLRDADKGVWAAAAIASSATMGAILFVRMTVRAALAFMIAGTGSPFVTSGLADFAYVLTVLWFFPAAMFVMSGAFGLRQAGMISNRFLTAGVLAVVVALLGGTTWASDGFWAPDGAYSLISAFVVFLWIAVLSGFLVMKASAAKAPDRAAVPTP
jgi:hypothetical protein